MNKILSNPVKMDTEEAIESVHIKQFMLLESKIHLLFKQNSQWIKEDISIVKLNTSELHGNT